MNNSEFEKSVSSSVLVPAGRLSKEQIWYAAIAFSASLTDIRLGPVALVEIVIIMIGLYCIFTARSGFRTNMEVARCSTVSIYFLSALGVLSIYDYITIQFYIPKGSDSFLKEPPMLPFARVVELGTQFYGYLLVQHLIEVGTITVARAIRWYVWACVFSACVGLGGLILYYMGINNFAVLHIDTYENTLVRVNGFFNEGGPFGVYMLSGLIALWVSYEKGYIKGRSCLLSFLLLFAAFFYSKSKAGWATGLVVALVIALAPSSRAYIRLALITIGVALVTALVFGGIEGIQPSGYFAAYQRTERAVAAAQAIGGKRAKYDVNLETGRVAGLYIVPRMILDRPLTGVGFGNYPVTRNNPEYLGFLPATDYYDLSGLGLLSILSEIGFPLTLFLLILILEPLLLSIRWRESPAVVGGSTFQIVAHTAGVQLTFFYPWLLSAILLCAIREAHPGDNKIKEKAKL